MALKPGDVTDVSGMRVGRTREHLVFGVGEKTPIPERELRWEEWTVIPEADISVYIRRGRRAREVHDVFTTFSFSCEKIYGKITIGARREGDAFRPAGRGCSKTLKQLFMELDIPSWERDAVPVLRDEKGILFVWGIGPDERFRDVQNDEEVGTIEIVRGHPDRGGCSNA